MSELNLNHLRVRASESERICMEVSKIMQPQIVESSFTGDLLESVAKVVRIKNQSQFGSEYIV